MTKILKRVIKQLVFGADVLREEEMVLQYKAVFSGEAGERVLGDLCRRFHILGSTFSLRNTNESFLKEGERNAVLYILSMVNKGETP